MNTNIPVATQNAITEAVEDLKAAYTFDEIGEKFVARSMDSEFENIGRIVRRGEAMACPDYIYVWIGFDLVRKAGKPSIADYRS